MKQKEFKDWTFDEVVDHAAGELLQDILNGTKFRTAAWRAVELGLQWNKEVTRPKPKMKSK